VTQHKGLVNAFIAFHILCIAGWSVPGPAQSTTLRSGLEVITQYMLRSGLWQGWDMFAPEPLSLELDLIAEVTFADGRQATWVFPRMQEMGLFERYQKERWRKWRERVRLDAFSPIWPDTARWIARHFDSPEHPVRSVALVRRWRAIPPPVGPSLAPRAAGTPTHQYRFFVLTISPGDLK
jgi:hypothetical protein